ncbi:hypothetical protein YC2023_064587 [Brassica napus]
MYNKYIVSSTSLCMIMIPMLLSDWSRYFENIKLTPVFFLIIQDNVAKIVRLQQNSGNKQPVGPHQLICVVRVLWLPHGTLLANTCLDVEQDFEGCDVLPCSQTIKRDIKIDETSKDLPIIMCGGFNMVLESTRTKKMRMNVLKGECLLCLFKTPKWCRIGYTQDENRLYLIIVYHLYQGSLNMP